jgi:hypothetical protein
MQKNKPPHQGPLAAAIPLLLLLASTAVGAEPAGQIKRMEGEVTIVRNQQKIAARPGIEIEARDRLITGKNGAAGFTTTDNSLVSLGPNSQLVIEQYAFNQQSQDGNIAFRFLKGSFAVVSGLLAKLQPEKSKFSTPTATIGIRGTEFVVRIELPAEREAEILGAEGMLQ